MNKYTEAQKAAAVRLCESGKTMAESERITGVKQNTIKALLRHKRESNQTINGADIEEKIEEAGQDNERVIDSKSRRISTLKQLIDFCEIDLSVWHIDRHIINKWEVGINSDGVVITSPLFQVKAWLTKINPEPIKPVIQPIQINADIPKVTKTKKAGYRKALLLGDAQIGFTRSMRSGELSPFHDRRAIDIVFQLLRKYDYDLVVIGGDWLDFSMWSKQFLKKPSFYFTTQPALVECAYILSVIRQLQPKAEITFLEGNHEIRPEKAIMEHFIDGYGLRSADNVEGAAVMSIPNLLGLPKLQIDYQGNYPANEYWLNNQAVIRHGDTARKGSGASVSALAREAISTEIVFHIHRLEMVSKTIHTREGTEIINQFCPGCLCRIDGTVPGDDRPNWQQGIAVINYDERRYVNIEPIPIHDGQAMYRDEIYTGVDYTDTLRKATTFKDKTSKSCEWNF